jgi:hypothetical protein
LLTVGSPTPPQGVTATVGPGPAAVTVTWTAPATGNGAPVTGYTVTTRFKSQTVGTKTVASTARSVVIGGLQSGQPYTFAVSATNSRGTGPPSAPSAQIVAP